MFVGVLYISLNACSNTKYLANDEKLYTRTWFNMSRSGKINNMPLKSYELYTVGSAKTNSIITFGPRVSLTFYNYWKTEKERGLKYLVYKGMSKPPVLLSDVNTDFRRRVMQQRLIDMGHFDSKINVDLFLYGKENKKVKAKYNVLFNPAYTFREIKFIRKISNVDELIAVSLSKSIIKKDEDYWLTTLQQERKRISDLLKDEGYYYFNPDYLLFHVDTTLGNRQVDIALVVKDGISKKAYHQYTIHHVNVSVLPINPAANSTLISNSVVLNNISYSSVGNPYKPNRITKAISIFSDSIYSSKAYLNTVKYLQGMGTFRSVEVAFTEVDSINGLLDANIRLTPSKPIATKFEMNFSTKSNDFIGPAAIASIANTNMFGGAEKLVLQIDGGFEWQRKSRRERYELGFNSYEIGTQLKLSFPRFLVPFSIKNESDRYVPQTNISGGFRSQKRVKYYTMNLSQIKYDYTWKTSPKKEFKFEPIAINYLNLTETSEEFDQFLIDYPQVALSFEQQFIVGSTFNYTYVSNPKRHQTNQFYYRGGIDIAGNVLNAAYTWLGEKGEGKPDPSTLFGVPFAQFAKFTHDFRYYLVFNEKKQLAFRLLGGVGIPYGNSEVLPYVKQYYAGGSHDIRAFYARSIGPGSYEPQQNENINYYLDQSGDIKLLGSMEYRFPLLYRLNGALFVDAGNIWLLNEDPSRPGGKFAFNSFVDQIAVGAGAGLRLDLTYFIFRLDAAVPVRKPYPVAQGRWIFENSSFFGDYIISLAVGYPF